MAKKSDPTKAYKKLLAQNAKQMKTMRKKLQKQAKALFTKLSKVVFANNPTLESFSWTQYTPYFNDGDECTFSVNGKYSTLTFEGDVKIGSEHCSSDYVDGKFVPKVLTPEELEQNRAYEFVQQFIGTFAEDDLKTMFGDHVSVTATRDSTAVSKYDHD